MLPALRKPRQNIAILAIVCLSLLVAVGAWLPGVARVVFGPGTHVCHCELRASRSHGGDARGGHHEHPHCGCPLCVPELRDHDGLGNAEVKGTCGDDDPGLRGLAAPAVMAAGFVLAPPALRVDSSFTLPLAPRQWRAPVESPPPRSLAHS